MEVKPSASKAGRNLPAATAVGVSLFAAVAATLAFWHWGFVLMAAAALTLGAVEVHRALERLAMHSALWVIMAGTLVIVVGSYATSSAAEAGAPNSTFLLVALGLTVLAALAQRMLAGPEGFVKDAAASLFIIGYLPLMGCFVALMMVPADGPARIITFILCVMANDIGGYAVGVLAGAHPMAPKISPKKTWEGFAGSVFFGLLIGALSAVFLLGAPFWVGLIIGVALVASATAGDLVESMIKRDVGIKDMSSLLPGHGGIMDRLDSLLVSAPVAWILMYWLVPVA